MIPEFDLAQLEREEEQPSSRTWKLDMQTGRVTGMIDELEAMKQAVFKILQTDRFWHEIYSFNYGHELQLVIGTHPYIAESEAKRIISEALLQDERIREVNDFHTVIRGDELTVAFTVETDYGNINMEVRRDV